MAEVDAGAVAPVVPVAPASTDAPAPESTADQVVETPEGDKPVDEPRLTQSEVNKIVAKRVAQESRRLERIARAEAERDYYKRLHEGQQPKQTQQPSGEPKQTDFTDYEEYLLAKAEWRFEQKSAARQADREKETSAQHQARQHQGHVEFVQTNLIDKGMAQYDDFREVVMSENVPITQAMVAAAARLPRGADVLYQLANANPQELRRIAELNDVEQVWELKAHEAKLTATRPTTTPPPIVPSGGQARVTKSYPEMTTAEHVKAYHKRSRR